MITLDKKIKELLLGSLFYGTGGGGSPQKAMELYKSILKTKQLKLAAVSDFKSDMLFATAFGVGSIATPKDPAEATKRAYEALTTYTKKKISGIIPVEIGPDSLATAFYLASFLNVPVIDADMVGGRSTPEVFLETITLFGRARTPAAIANTQGDCALLTKSSSPQQEEVFFRNFAALSGGAAQVVGYVMRQDETKKYVEQGTVSRAVEAGKFLRNGRSQELVDTLGGAFFGEGTITVIKEKKEAGFMTCIVTIVGKKTRAKIFVKNENLILWLNDRPALTCPDLIILLDKNGVPVYNKDLKKGLSVVIIGVPTTPLWRSKKGLALFNPKVFGFDVKTRLL